MHQTYVRCGWQAYELHLRGMNAKGRQSWDPVSPPLRTVSLLTHSSLSARGATASCPIDRGPFCPLCQLAVLVAVRGAASVNCSKMEEGGFNYVDENGANFWTPPDNSSNVSVQSLLTLSGTHPWREERELAGRAIDDLLCASPVVPESTSGRAG
jgi:hypothetical protein